MESFRTTNGSIKKLFLQLLIIAWALLPSAAASFEYNVCNGLSNQLLIHASAIAKAIQQKATVVHVPDYFIVHGEQTSDEPVLPTTDNSVPLGQAFDMTVLQQRLSLLGIRMELSRKNTQLDCPGLSWLSSVDPQLVLQILQAFQPAPRLRDVIDKILGSLPQQGICFHHRDGQDWHEHCQRWSAQQEEDGIYRGNCEAPQNESLVELLENRALHASHNTSTGNKRWIYYCGDHQDDIPKELLALQQKQNQTIVVQKNQFLTDDDKQALQAVAPKSNTTIRDLWALLDFFICAQLPYLVGNSVSTFTALQIALRGQEGAYWYNSQSIPLADVWNIYQIPIVYTYTELSDPKGKYLLQASIASLRQHMPQNKVYILYHGEQDSSFRQWLLDQHVTIFQHQPHWKDAIERLRVKGNAASSHLFGHAGNYFGTWQRIDIPQFLETEYILFLDADTILIQPFTLRDFGLNLTRSIGMSAERNREHVGNLLNAGVTLMNVPTMRATYNDFLKFILDRETPNFSHPAPSDQGAYLEFYQDSVVQISNYWNWKSYWGFKAKNNLFAKIKILHFHGIKPHDYVAKVMGLPCNLAIRELCAKFKQPKYKAANTIPNFHRDYCYNAFDDSTRRQACVAALDGLRDRRSDQTLSESQKKRRLDILQTEDGFWDGNHKGLNSKVVTVSRPEERVAEEKAKEPTTIKLRELSYHHDYDHFFSLPDEAQQLVPEQGPPGMSSSAPGVSQFQMMLVTFGATSILLFFYIYLRKSRRLFFFLVCGSVAWRHILALNAIEHTSGPGRSWAS